MVPGAVPEGVQTVTGEEIDDLWGVAVLVVLLALWAALAGCTSTPVVLPPNLPPEQWENAQELGVPLHQAELENDGLGQIVVTHPEQLEGCKDTPTAVGCAMRRKICQVLVEVKQGAPTSVLAHEIGHALVLSHSPDAPHSVMAPSTSGTNLEVTEEQRLVMRLGAEVLRTCRQIAKRRAQ